LYVYIQKYTYIWDGASVVHAKSDSVVHTKINNSVVHDDDDEDYYDDDDHEDYYYYYYDDCNEYGDEDDREDPEDHEGEDWKIRMASLTFLLPSTSHPSLHADCWVTYIYIYILYLVLFVMIRMLKLVELYRFVRLVPFLL